MCSRTEPNAINLHLQNAQILNSLSVVPADESSLCKRCIQPHEYDFFSTQSWFTSLDPIEAYENENMYVCCGFVCLQYRCTHIVFIGINRVVWYKFSISPFFFLKPSFFFNIFERNMTKLFLWFSIFDSFPCRLTVAAPQWMTHHCVLMLLWTPQISVFVSPVQTECIRCKLPNHFPQWRLGAALARHLTLITHSRYDAALQQAGESDRSSCHRCVQQPDSRKRDGTSLEGRRTFLSLSCPLQLGAAVIDRLSIGTECDAQSSAAPASSREDQR